MFPPGRYSDGISILGFRVADRGPWAFHFGTEATIRLSSAASRLFTIAHFGGRTVRTRILRSLQRRSRTPLHLLPPSSRIHLATLTSGYVASNGSATIVLRIANHGQQTKAGVLWVHRVASRRC
jgi:hypothetical protein